MGDLESIYITLEPNLSCCYFSCSENQGTCIYLWIAPPLPPPMHSISRKYSIWWKFSLQNFYIFRTAFLIKFLISDQSLTMKILTPLCLQFRTSVHAQIANHDYLLMHTVYEFPHMNWVWAEAYIGDTLWQMKLIYDLINLVTWLL